ncbi:MAG: hypothetical protein ACXWQO_05255 [Bdellovibrionota bacterium]
MQKIFAALLFLSLTAPYAHAEMKWTGSAGVRYLNRKLDDGLGATGTTGADASKATNKRYEMRGNLGVSDTSEHLDWNIGLRTQANPASEWLSVQNSANQAFGLELANLRYHTKEWLESDWAIVAGRQKAAFLYDAVGQGFLDRDNRWDGFGWNFKHGAFGFNAAQYVLGATSQGTAAQSSAFTSTEATQSVSDTRSHFGVLYSFQPTFEFQVNEDIKALFAVGYHNWSGTGGSSTSNWYTNPIHGGVANSSAGVAVGNVNPVIMDNARQWQLYTDWTLPYSLRFVGEYIRNKNVVYGTSVTPTTVKAKRDMYSLSLVYGVAKKAHDWTVMYTYASKGVASVINTFTNGDAPVDNTAHMFEGKYLIADGFSVGGKLQYHKEIAKVGGDGVALTAPNANRLQKQRRIELYTGISF